jgi:hypothetical protein
MNERASTGNALYGRTWTSHPERAELAGQEFVCWRRSWQPENEDFTVGIGAKLRLRTVETTVASHTPLFLDLQQKRTCAQRLFSAKNELHSQRKPHFSVSQAPPPTLAHPA